MTDTDLQDFINVYNPDNRENRVATECFRAFSYNERIEREQINLDIFWLKADSLEDAADLPTPDVLVAEITENLAAALAKFQDIQTELDRND